MQIRFEHGTLVCEPEDDRDELRDLPGAVWDDEHRVWRVAAERYAATVHWLAVRRVRFSDTLPDWRLAVRWEVPALQWYQAAALERWRAAELRGVIALPAGPAAMLVALAAITRLGLATLCLVPDLPLLDTWRSTLATGTGLSIGKLGDGAPRIAPLTVATYAAAAVWGAQLGDKYGLVIVDEAHRVGTACPPQVLELLVAPARLGLTSLPPQTPAVLERKIGPTVYDAAREPRLPEPVPSIEIPPGLPIDVPPEPPAEGPSRAQPDDFADIRTQLPEALHAAIDRALLSLVGRSRAVLSPFTGGVS